MNPETYISITPQKPSKIWFQKTVLIFLFSVSLLTFHVSRAYAQPVQQQWVSRYQRTLGSVSNPNILALDKVGNEYVCGTIFDTITQNDIILIKYNATGDTLWSRRYDNANKEDEPKALSVDSLGYVYITCETGQNLGHFDILTLKFDPSGVLLWAKTYITPAGAGGAPSDMKLDKQGNIYITGALGSVGSAITIKYNSNGDTLWVRLKQENNYKYYGVSLDLDVYDSVYVAIIKVNTSNNLDAFLVVKYGADGVEKRTTTHNNNSAFDILSSFTVDRLGNSFILGTTFSGYTTIKFDTSGNESWVRNYTNNHGESAYAIVTDFIGNCYVTGASSTGGSNNDYLTIKYNPSGDSIWVRRYNGPGNGNDEAYSIVLDDSNMVYITGRSIGSGSSWDYATIKYDGITGNIAWLMRYNNSTVNSEDVAYSLTIDKNNNVYVTGVSHGLGNIYDYLTIKYSQPPNGILPISNNTPTVTKLYQNYPNPFNPNTNIEYQILKNNYVQLIIYDILGNEVEKLVNEYQKTGMYKASWNANKYSSGIYFYELITENYAETKKMLLVK